MPEAMSLLDMPLLDQVGEQRANLCHSYIRDRQATNPGEGVIFQSAALLQELAGCPFRFLHRQPLASDRFETVGCAIGTGSLFGLALDAWIYALRKQFA
ncbi:hypothetical protein UU7_07496 [Rhodanobacter spathiphylli B39]|uniref:Uncharacterized protein n=1 Tax=Rhodanobacter spathiphylli B39 TaxID=1163407 RepID=I4W2H8_9GAMM|nr:hypothetical protein UU7_07496 [Rhodanobacter spathiphylli B39]